MTTLHLKTRRGSTRENKTTSATSHRNTVRYCHRNVVSCTRAIGEPKRSFNRLVTKLWRLTRSAAWFVAIIVPTLRVSAEMTVACTDNADHSITTCRIDQPVVTQEARLGRRYPVTFHPGDLVTIEAGGCVQTGGWGATWKRYVNPKGDNANRLYHGTIWMPGTGIPRGVLKEILPYLNRPITIPAGTVAPDNVLVLGFVDDGYDDNGYWNHDDGTDGQCKMQQDGGPAWLTVRIEHNKGAAQSAVPSPFDLVSDTTDSNGLFLNPKWGWEADPRSHNPPYSNGRQSITDFSPDPEKLCDGFAYAGGDPNNGISFGAPPCTSQIGPHDIDSPAGVALGSPPQVNSAACTLFGGRSGALHGHVNWWPATITGHIIWHGHMTGLGFDPMNAYKLPPEHGDDDYCFYLDPTNNGLGNISAEYQGWIESEMDSDETVDHFGSGWWKGFRDAVDQARPEWDYSGGTPAAMMINPQEAIITGLVGIDEEHDGHSELHPIYAMAIHANPIDYSVTYDPIKVANSDRWAVFARNWGDEGFCSQDQHLWDIPEISIFIPEPLPSSDYAILDQEFSGSGGDKPLTVEHSKVPGGVVIKFGLGSPDNRPMIDGFVRIHWVTIDSSPGVTRPSRPPIDTDLHLDGHSSTGSRLPIEGHSLNDTRSRIGTDSHSFSPKDLQMLMFGEASPTKEMIDSVLARKREEPKYNLLKGLSPDKIAWVKQQLKEPSTVKNTTKINATRVVLPAEMSPHRVARITPPRMRAVYDTVRAEKLRHLREVLCAAHDNNIPDLPGVCSDVVIPPRGRPTPPRGRPTPQRGRPTPQRGRSPLPSEARPTPH